MADNFDAGRGRGKKNETHEGGRERRRIRTGDLFHGSGIALGSAIAGTGESACERAGDDPGTDTFRGHAQLSGIEERIEAETDLSRQTLPNAAKAARAAIRTSSVALNLVRGLGTGRA